MASSMRRGEAWTISKTANVLRTAFGRQLIESRQSPVYKSVVRT